MSERLARAHQRYAVQLPVELDLDGRTLRGLSRNLSLGGMFIELEEALVFNAVVALRFQIPTLREPVEVLARVRWLDGRSGVGLQFEGLRPGTVWALQRLFRTVAQCSDGARGSPSRAGISR